MPSQKTIDRFEEERNDKMSSGYTTLNVSSPKTRNVILFKNVSSPKTRNVILFNGPPYCGKDTAAKAILEEGPKHFPTIGDVLSGGQPHRIKMDRFSSPLKGGFAGVTSTYVDGNGYNAEYEPKKEQVIDWLGVSYRQFQIDFSEKFMKPLYGIDIFGKIFCMRNRLAIADLIVVPDSGFKEEAIPVIEAFGKDNVLLIRIHRDGFDFSKDSRSYIKDIGCKELDVYNNEGVNSFKGKILDIVDSWLRKKE